MHCCILIPAYEPGNALPDYVSHLIGLDIGPVLVVDDGSGPDYRPVFGALEGLEGCTVLRHRENRGKGAALKTGIAYYLAHFSSCGGIITADCDGQHTPEDILAVCTALLRQPEALILGVRTFDQHTPLRSRMGNRAASLALSALCGISLRDTQTGLRGLPNGMLEALENLKGERFEYELHMLLLAHRMCVPMVQIPIHTLYFDGNRGSHFRTFRDLWPIVALLAQGVVEYVGAAALSVVIDVGVYALLVKVLLRPLALPRRLFFSTVVARTLSSVANYACNRRLPLVQNRKILPTLAKYYALWAGQLCASFGLTWLLSGVLYLDDLLGKLLADLFLALVSYQVQLRWVFRVRKKAAV